MTDALNTSVATAIRGVLLAGTPVEKIKLARKTARDWRLGRLAHAFDVAMPVLPARPAEPVLMAPSAMPRRGKGSGHGRIALIHAIAHIEYSAIDLAFDIAGRFGAEFPRSFIDDWLAVGADEAMHFALLDRRLRNLGSRYGALPAHDGLWEAAADTAHDPLARLAIVPMVLEARGLDVTPATQARFAQGGDQVTARILGRILSDEIRHVGAGTKWFRFGCDQQRISATATWQKLVGTHFHGRIKPPFNDSARDAAGLTREYYGALASN